MKTLSRIIFIGSLVTFCSCTEGTFQDEYRENDAESSNSRYIDNFPRSDRNVLVYPVDESSSIIVNQAGFEKAKQAATYHLNRLRNTEMTPGWSEGAQLSDYVQPIYRPDMAEPAYYEFGVDDGGFIIAATGEHDNPIVQFSDGPDQLTKTLTDQSNSTGQQIRKIYRLDPLTFAAEDSQGQLVGQLGDNLMLRLESPTGKVSEWGDWPQLKMEYEEVFQKELELKRGVANTKWKSVLDTQIRNVSPTGDNPILYSGSYDLQNVNPVPSKTYWIHYPYLLQKQILFRQFEYSGCAVGCGPVAWAQLTAYVDFLGHTAAKYYNEECKTYDLYDGLISFSSSDGNQNEVSEELMRDLNHALNTFCAGSQGATDPISMNNYEDWAQEKGANIEVDSNRFLGQESHARRWLKMKYPVVIGLGFFQHYVVGVGYGIVGDDEYVYINNGHGGYDNGWIELDGFFYSAAIKKKGA